MMAELIKEVNDLSIRYYSLYGNLVTLYKGIKVNTLDTDEKCVIIVI
jgi:hypothetical protein